MLQEPGLNRGPNTNQIHGHGNYKPLPPLTLRYIVMASFKVPTEIWLHIISFIPKHARRELLSVNSVFLHEGMAARYNLIEWRVLGPNLLKYLDRFRFVLHYEPEWPWHLQVIQRSRYLKTSARAASVVHVYPDT